MGYKRRQLVINKLVIFAIGLLILFLYVYHQYQTSIILTEKDRVNIAVFSEMPFVYSINVRKNFAVVTYFHPDYLVKVPGGYDWYRIGSLNLLGKIEKQRTKILKNTFAELLGVPIDIVYYPKKATIIDKPNSTFNEFYYNFVRQSLFSKAYQSSFNNYFDNLLIKNLFQVRQDHLVFLDTLDLNVKEHNRRYYYSDKLDTRLKGMFYHESLINDAYKAIITTSKEGYKEAQLILRQLEGVGIKVIEIEVVPKYKLKQCVIKANKTQQAVIDKLTRLFDCRAGIQNSEIISYTL